MTEESDREILRAVIQATSEDRERAVSAEARRGLRRTIYAVIGTVTISFFAGLFCGAALTKGLYSEREQPRTQRYEFKITPPLNIVPREIDSRLGRYFFDRTYNSDFSREELEEILLETRAYEKEQALRPL